MEQATETTNIPRHVAIIMDGNGRWANARSHARVWGHIRGTRVVSRIVEDADDIGIKALTLYAFSTENWCRPKDEIKTLFKLLKKFLQIERRRILANNIHFRVVGDISALPSDTVKLINDLEEETIDNQGLKLTFAFGYGSRQEITSSINHFIVNNPGKLITEEDLAANLYAPDLGDVDLLIRTGGDHRISNFLLWQCAYAEFYFTDTKWPDFNSLEFRKIIENVSKRERRFGAVCARQALDQTREEAKINLNSLSSTAHV